MEIRMGTTSFFTRITRFVLALLALVGVFGVTPVSAQQSGNIYAVADLVPQGAEPDPHVGGSSATFESVETGGTRVTVVLLNVQPNAQYAVDIRDNSCSGSVLHTLQTVTSDATGSSRSVTDIPASVEFGRWHVTVNDAGAVPGTALLCGQANPALAGPLPPVDAPGMPRTGQEADLAGLSLGALGLMVAGLVAWAVVYRRSRLPQHK